MGGQTRHGQVRPARRRVTARLVLKLTTNREIRHNETAVKVQGNHVRFIFNKYNLGRQLYFELGGLFDGLESRVVSRTVKGNFATFTFKKKRSRRWPDLLTPGARRMSGESQPNYPKHLKKFNSAPKGRERNNRYMSADNDFEKYTILVPEEDCILEERDEGSESSTKLNSHRMIPSTREISKQVNEALEGGSDSRSERAELGELESFMQNENLVLKVYGKGRPKAKLYARGNKPGAKREGTPEAGAKKHRAKLYQNRTPKNKSSYKNRYMQKSQERQERIQNLRKGKSATERRKQKGRAGKGERKNYFNSWLNKEEKPPKEAEKEEPKLENISKTGFKKTLNEELMTIDEIIALEKKEATQNSKLRKATRTREKKNKQAQRRRKPAAKGLANKGTQSGGSMPQAPHEMPLATFTTRPGEFDKVFDLHKRSEVTPGDSGRELKRTQHREKSNHELKQLKMSRKSIKNIEGLAQAMASIKDSVKDLNKVSFVENLPSQRGEGSRVGSRMVSRNNSEADEVRSNIISMKSDIRGPSMNLARDVKPQSKSNIDLNGGDPAGMGRSKSRPLKPNKGGFGRRAKVANGRSRSTIAKGPKSSMSGTRRGLSQNLSNLAAHTVVSYDGPNVSIISQKLREKRAEILDTFAQLNLDMAWVHRQCRYIDLHSTQGVLKFFELQNRLVVKLATKLRKEKNARFKVEKQCEKMVDSLKKDLGQK